MHAYPTFEYMDHDYEMHFTGALSLAYIFTVIVFCTSICHLMTDNLWILGPVVARMRFSFLPLLTLCRLDVLQPISLGLSSDIRHVCAVLRTFLFYYMYVW